MQQHGQQSQGKGRGARLGDQAPDIAVTMKSMRVSYGPKLPMHGDYAALRDHHRIGQWVADRIAEDPRFRGRVLDVGCGGGTQNPHIRPLYDLPARIDGVDPSPGVHEHPFLASRWQAPFEEADLPADAYDALLAFNVVEHVDRPDRFMAQAYRVLKPGGRFYAVTPTGTHPFAWTVRLLQALRLKERLVASREGWNDYPAWYRLNSRGAIARHGDAAGFERAQLTYHPTLQWHQYFPRPLRFAPAAFDYALGLRLRPLHARLLFYLEKPGPWPGPSGADPTPS